MMTIARSFEWDMGHRVTNHDSLCRNPHGHRYRMIVEINGPLNDKANSPKQGMIMDFGSLKQLIDKRIISKLDHAFLYWYKDKVMRDFAKANKNLRMNGVDFVPTVELIVQDLASSILRLLKREMPEVKLVSVKLFETPNSWALWRNDGKS